MIVFAAAVVAKASVPTITLRNGIRMPRVVLGMGPWCNDQVVCPKPDPPCRDCYTNNLAAADVEVAFAAGFNGVDEALGYRNQLGVGRALSSWPRQKVWVTSKVRPCQHDQSVDDCAEQTQTDFDQDLRELGVSYLDLVLLHSPVTGSMPGSACSTPELCDLVKVQWATLSKLYNRSATRAVGVSNYCGTCLMCLDGMEPVPHVNQIQYHAGMPGADPTGLVSLCARQGIQVQAYSPLGNYKTHSLLHSNVTAQIGRRVNRTAAQVALRWVLQNNVSLAVAASNYTYLVQDLDVFNWSLPSSDMELLNKLPIAPEDPTRGICR